MPKALLTIVAILLTVCPLAGGSTPADSSAYARVGSGTASIDSMQYLRGITVLGQKPYAEVIPAQTLSGARLRQLDSHSVADALRYFSGIQLKDYGGVGGLKTVDIRSMGSNHMGVFYDGIQLGNAQNGQVDLGRFSLYDVDDIALYNGQKSDILQPARDYGTSGQIYIRPRTPRFAPAQHNNLSASVATGSFGLIRPALRWEHRFSRHVSASVSGDWTYATGEYRFRYRQLFSDGTVAWDTTATRHNGDLHALRMEAALYGSTDNGTWNARAYYYNSKRGIPGAIVSNVWKMAQRQWDRNFFVQGSWQQRISERYTLLARAKYARDYLRYHNPDTTLMYVDNRFWQDEIYVTTAHRITILPDWDASLSADYQWNYLNSTMVNFAYPTRHTAMVAIATAYTLRTLKVMASGLLTAVHDRSTDRNNGVVLQQRRTWRTRLTPSVALSWQPTTLIDLNLRAFYKRAFRMPTFNDLYYTDIGNASLRPETATQYNIGVQYDLHTEAALQLLRVQADAYYNLVDDKIIAIPTGSGQYRWTMTNIGRVRIRGIDTNLRLRLLIGRVGLETTLAYTYQRAQDYSHPEDSGDGGTYRGQIAYVPRHSGSVAAHLSWRGFNLDYSFIYVGERYHTSANIHANYEQPWYTHDLGAGYTLPLSARCKATAILQVSNLFNQQYDVIHNYPMPGRNYRFTLKFDLQ